MIDELTARFVLTQLNGGHRSCLEHGQLGLPKCFRRVMQMVQGLQRRISMALADAVAPCRTTKMVRNSIVCSDEVG